MDIESTQPDRRTAIPLEYAGRGSAWKPPSEALQRIAFYLGAIPLVSGVGILILFLITRWKNLALAGLWTILIGAVFFVIGFICIIVYMGQIFRSDPATRPESWKRFALTLLLLLGNWLVAFICAQIGAANM